MTSETQPITLWGKSGPNPLKVEILIRELGLAFAVNPIQFSDIKKPEYLAVNPNGRLPSIQDPNTGLTLWESGAIIEYLIERYDKEHRLGFQPGTSQFYHAKQWLYFQTTGQGPYYGQMTWFKKFHPEKVPSAVERYVGEIKRVTGVLESHLQKQKDEFGEEGAWLVGGKLSFADLAFIPWQRMVGMFLTKEEFDDEQFPLVKEWMKRMVEREVVKKTLQDNNF
ncbi:glutathione S-transferase family protein [Aspergillus melleus]|uniref:glutathione S-transferase family protein n=1 Tax=Aspergillus melleus TaxID=138277 RepID=UPI001E8D8B80|nr:glutathione S- transferase, nitrogen catabolite repression regulator [Aspergillus melleus]KAH8429330.1 glutathione S- transferase, nitrogen catabolite repression regulator [Aspergillus melleus]